MPDRLLPNGNASPKIRMVGWLVGYVGLPGLMCGWLIYVGSMQVPNIALKTELIYAQELEKQKRDAELKQMMDANYRMLQRICVRLSRNDDERNGCFDK